MPERTHNTRFSSPVDYATATSMSFQDAIHSTPQALRSPSQPHARATSNNSTRQLDGLHDHSHNSDMSIEIGRGGKHNYLSNHGDISSDMAISFAMDNSRYELNQTPPLRPLTNPRLRPHVVPASNKIQRSASGSRQRVASEAMRSSRLAPPTSQPLRSMNQGANQNSTRASVLANATVQSTTYTANHSFVLPDMANLTELVSGGLGHVTASGKQKSRSRFTSGPYDSQDPPYHNVNAIELPQDEKAIYSSLQSLKDKVSQLELEKSEALQQAEQWEREAARYQRQLRARGQVDDDNTKNGRRVSAPVSNKTLQDRLADLESRYATKIKETERLTQEKEYMLEELSQVYIKNENLLDENDMLAENRDILQTECDELKVQLEELRLENESLRADLPGGSRKASRTSSTTNNKTSTTRSSVTYSKSARDASQNLQDPRIALNVASQIAQQVQKHREEAEAKRDVSQQLGRRASSHRVDPDTVQSRASTHRRQATQDSIDLPAPMPALKQERRSTSTKVVPTIELGDDITILSDLEPNFMENIRRKVEEEYRQRKTQNHKTATQSREPSMTRQSLPRKSSLKDINLTQDSLTGRINLTEPVNNDILKVAKSVRVQSPQASSDAAEANPVQENDTGKLSISSNISRRRRRASSLTTGETSAFIIPDITLHRSASLPTNLTAPCIPHKSTTCTLCHPTTTNIPIPPAIPISTRTLPFDPDLTAATIRPTQPPTTALNLVVKQLEDEITHLKLQLAEANTAYLSHDPAYGARRRSSTLAKMKTLTTEVERRTKQVYALYDVLEAHKATVAEEIKGSADGVRKVERKGEGEFDLEATLSSLGIDPVELSGRVGRASQGDLPAWESGEESAAESDGLPWEGLSEFGSEEE